MRTLHRFRRSTCRWLGLALLFMQFATAAYACPAAFTPARAPAAMAEMLGCAGNLPMAMDLDQPLLCQAHCQQGSQTVQASLAADLPSSPVLLAVLDWRPALHLPSQPAEVRPALARGASPPGSPPLYLRLLVLRN